MPVSPAKMQALMAKADLCLLLSRRMLGWSIHELIVEDQAVEMMRLPTKTLKLWVSRLPKRWKPYRTEKRVTRRVARPWWERLEHD